MFVSEPEHFSDEVGFDGNLAKDPDETFISPLTSWAPFFALAQMDSRKSSSQSWTDQPDWLAPPMDTVHPGIRRRQSPQSKERCHHRVRIHDLIQFCALLTIRRL